MSISIEQKRTLFLVLLGISPFFINGYINSFIYNNLVLYWAFEFLIWLICPAIIVYILSRSPEFNIADLGFKVGIWNRSSVEFLAFICLLFALPCYWLYSNLYWTISSYFPSQGVFQYSTVIPEDRLERLIVIAYFSLTAGVVEELYFRGLLFKALAGYKNHLLIFMIVSPVLFSLIHWESGLANVLSTYLYGLFFAGAYFVFQNIWPLVFGHTVTDFIWFSQ